MSRFKPIEERVILCPGTDKGAAKAARKMLSDSRITYAEFSLEDSFPPYDDAEYPTIFVSGRPYPGLEKIKRASRNIHCA